mmetsp:Transcript_21624/g.46242  ORF Transcript_21624/g.46242 Transcript_21624/m.46242 type:complete len:104 (+) Transcript_21624:73-384(+)
MDKGRMNGRREDDALSRGQNSNKGKQGQEQERASNRQTNNKQQTTTNIGRPEIKHTNSSEKHILTTTSSLPRVSLAPAKICYVRGGCVPRVSSSRLSSHLSRP